MDEIILFAHKEECCGCSACKNICPKSAIRMEEDCYGFLYPIIDKQLCIACHACEKVCGYQKRQEESKPLQVLVAARKDKDKIMKSASGGIFAALAEDVLSEGGLVFGASMEYENNQLVPKHIEIENIEELTKLQGSKYVQSEIGDTYRVAKEKLLKGKKVLFSGTPCQIGGLKQYLGKDFDNLLTVDIICHGVPNARFFQSYIKCLEKKLNGRILDFKFRDKSKGWGLNGKIVYEDNHNKVREKYISHYDSSYFKLFLESSTYRESCYSCKYCNDSRPSDITLGDYWGIQKEHPEAFQEKGSYFNQEKGISVVVVSSIKGKNYIQKCNYMLYSLNSTYSKAARKNGQLTHPSKRSDTREKILELYKNEGYEVVESYFKRHYKLTRIKGRVKRLVPKKIKRMIKRVI